MMLTVKELKAILTNLSDDAIIVVYYNNDSSNDKPDLKVHTAFADCVEDVLCLEASLFEGE